ERAPSAQPTARPGRRDERGRSQPTQPNAQRSARREAGQPQARGTAGKASNPRQRGNEAGQRQPQQQQPAKEPRQPRPAPAPAVPASAENPEARKQAPARPERAPRPPQVEQSATALATAPTKDAEAATNLPLETGVTAPETKPEAEGGQPRRRRGRRGGRRRRRHEDGTPIQDIAGSPLEELDDEDREEGDESVVPHQGVQASTHAPVLPAAIAVSSVAGVQVEDQASAHQAETRSALPEVLDAVRPAPVAAFNLPPLPPIPAQTPPDEAQPEPSVAKDAADTVRVVMPEAPADTYPTAGGSEPAVAPESTAAVESEADTPAAVEPAQPAPSGTPVPGPKQGDLLASAKPAELPHVDPSTDTHQPKDAAQG
ncbi:MAG: hypothetical protein HOQ10_10155, partial [Frateuria sp.]|nr:hypothetical protein [Frateuria sp.]